MEFISTYDQHYHGDKKDLFKKCYDSFLHNCENDQEASHDGTIWKNVCSKKVQNIHITIDKSHVDGHKNLCRFRVNCIFETTPEKAMALTFDGNRRLEWDTTLESIDVLKTFKKGFEMIRFVGKKYPMVKQREFINYQWKLFDETTKTYLCVWTGVDEEVCQIESTETNDYTKTPTNRIRGLNHCGSGWRFSPGRKEGTTEFQGCLTVDLKGKLLKKMVNKMTPSVLEGLCIELAKKIQAKT